MPVKKIYMYNVYKTTIYKIYINLAFRLKKKKNSDNINFWLYLFELILKSCEIFNVIIYSNKRINFYLISYDYNLFMNFIIKIPFA